MYSSFVGKEPEAQTGILTKAIYTTQLMSNKAGIEFS